MSVGGRRVVITGLGAVTPLGTGRDALWNGLSEGQCGIRPLSAFEVEGLEYTLAAEVQDFAPAKYVKQRKQLKLMARDIQLAMGSAHLAIEDSGLELEQVDRTRFGVNFGAGMIATELDEISPAVKASATSAKKVDLKVWGKEGLSHLFPLWMLKYLPNMPACHVSIAYDAQGPNNSITLGEAASTLAVGEAFRVIQRGGADVFIAGGTDSKIHPLSIVRMALLGRLTKRCQKPEEAIRPFDRERDGIVPGEGSASLILEEASFARRRGAKIAGEVLGFASYCSPKDAVGSIQQVAQRALADAGISAEDLGHISAMGASAKQEDRDEIVALSRVLGTAATRVPIVAFKSLVGPLASASGAVEMVASLLCLDNEKLPAVRNFHETDTGLPNLRILKEPIECPDKPFLSIARSYSGQCAAIVAGPYKE